jgi:hypothetical protein
LLRAALVVGVEERSHLSLSSGSSVAPSKKGHTPGKAHFLHQNHILATMKSGKSCSVSVVVPTA